MTFLMKKWNLYFDIYFDMWPNLRRWLKHCSAHSVLVPWMSEKIGRSGWNWHTGSFWRHFGLTWFFIWNLSTRYPVSFIRISARWLPFFARFCRNGWNSQARSYPMYLKCTSLSHLSDSSWVNSWDGDSHETISLKSTITPQGRSSTISPAVLLKNQSTLFACLQPTCTVASSLPGSLSVHVHLSWWSHIDAINSNHYMWILASSERRILQQKGRGLGWCKNEKVHFRQTRHTISNIQPNYFLSSNPLLTLLKEDNDRT